MEATYRFTPLTSSEPRVEASTSLVFSFHAGVRAVAIRPRQVVVVGRGEPSHIVIDDRSLSRVHARFWLEDGVVQVEDCGSTNGTTVEGTPIHRAALSSTQSARLGAVEVRVSGPSAESPRPRHEGESDFSRVLERELERARYFGRSCALVSVEGPPSIPSELARLLRPVDQLERYTLRTTLVLLPEAGELEVRSLADALQRMEPSGCKLGAALFPGSASSAETLIAESLRAVRSARPGQPQFAAADDPPDASQPIVQAPCMVRVHALITAAARTTIPVLITGETGSGKDSLATALHERSARAARPFKSVNSAALPSTLITSVLFGHERGAFTGADRQSPGLFEQAQGGTLFLDEVGELSLEAQAALLRVLETQRIVRVGGQKEIEVDVRLVAATHRDLPALVSEGRFREDLLYRLDAFTVRVPPLRERSEEILPLAEHFLLQSRARWGSSASALSLAVQKALVSYGWPGNVRQLRNVIERASALSAGTTIELDDLPDALFTKVEAPTPIARSSTLEAAPSSLPERMRQIEEEIIRDALDRTRGNQSEAARLLGLPRRTLANKAHQYGLVSKLEP